MKKEDFLNLGLTEEAAAAAAEASRKELEGYVPKEQAEALQAQLAQRDADIAGLKKAAGKDTEWKEKFTALEEKYTQEKEAMAKQLADTAKNNAVDMAILQAGGRNAKAVKALLDMEKVTLKEDGTLDGLDLDALKKSDGYLFSEETTKIVGTGAQAGTQDVDSVAAAFEAAVMG